jgi:hypothetical protein
MHEVHIKEIQNFMKEIKRELNKCKDIPCSWIGRLNITSCQSFQLVLHIQCNPNKGLNKLFHAQ